MAGIDQYNPLRIRNGFPSDAWYLNDKVPYASVAEACSLIPVADRSIGLTVLVGNDEYWWKFGVQDNQLEFKASGGSSGSGDVMSRTVSQLRVEASPSLSTRYFITDKNREGLFYYDSTDTTTPDDNGTVIVSGTKRFKRIYSGPVQATWFGIVGDNATDNYTELALLVNNTTFKHIEFPNGTYCTSAQLTINRSNLRISGPGTLKKTGTGADHLLYIDDVSNIWLDNITLEGSGLVTPYDPLTLKGNLVYLAQTAQNILIEGVTFKNSGKDGVYINEVGTYAPGQHAKNILIRRCSFDGITRNPISVISGENIRVEKNVFSNYQLVGIDCEPNAENTLITNVVAEDNIFYSHNSSSAALQGSSSDLPLKFNDLFFTGNIIYTAGTVNKSEIRIVNFPGSIVEGNEVYNANGAITIESDKVTVRLNKIKEPASIATSSVNTGAIYVVGDQCVVEKNEVSNINGNGIYVANSLNTIIAFNTVRNVNKSSATGAGYGILVRGGSTGLIVSNNIAQHESPVMAGGIRLENGAANPEGWLVTKNNIQGAALQVDTAYEEGNNIYDNGASDLLTEGSIPYIAPNGKPTESNAELFYDPITKRLGIGTNTPSGKFTVKVINQFSPANAPEWDSLFVDNSALTAADGAYGSGMAWNSLGTSTTSRKKAAIVSVQTSSDNDVVGIAFFVHDNGTSTTDLTERMRLDHHGVRIGNGAPSAITGAAIFETISTTKGSLPAPKMTTSQRDAIIGPVAGLLIYNTTTNQYERYTGSAWAAFAGGTTYTQGTGITISPEGVISATGSPGTNPIKAKSIEDHGGVADYLASGTTMTGTDNSAALAAAIAAAADEQLIVVPHGNWYFPTRIVLPTTKNVQIEIFGNVYAPNGMFEHTGMTIHRIVIHGEATGRLGITGHSRTDFLNNTGMNDYTAAMNWNTLAPALFYFNDVYRGFYSVKYATGYEAAFHFYGGLTGNEGGQEITCQANYLNRNKYGIWLQSADGTSYLDKITFSGLGGGTMRIGGHQSVFIDGGAAETGAARSNNFNNILFEYCNYAIKITGDATYNKFIGCRWEGGTETGCFSGEYINIKNVAVTGGKVPQGTQFIGCSHAYVDWLTNIGSQTSFVGTPIWNRNAEVMFSNTAVGHNSGRITIIANVGLSSFSRSNLPSNVDYIAYGSATPSPSTDSILFRNSATATEYIQKYSGGGTGGSSQWSDVTGGIAYAGKVRTGSSATPTAKNHVAGATSTSSGSGSNKWDEGVLLTTAEKGLWEFNASRLYFTRNTLREEVAFLPPNGGPYQMLRQNATGTAAEYVNQPFFLEYCHTLNVLVSTLTETSLLGGAKALKSKNLAVGDIVEVEGGGILQAGACHFKIVIGGYTATVVPTNTGTAGVDRAFNWKLRYVVESTGTAGGGSVRLVISIDGLAPKIFTGTPVNTINNDAPSVDLLFKWTSSAAAFTNLDSSITVKRVN